MVTTKCVCGQIQYDGFGARPIDEIPFNWDPHNAVAGIPSKHCLNSFSMDSSSFATHSLPKIIVHLRVKFSISCFRCLPPMYVDNNKCVSLLTATNWRFNHSSIQWMLHMFSLNFISLFAVTAEPVECCDGFLYCLWFIAIMVVRGTMVRARKRYWAELKIIWNFNSNSIEIHVSWNCFVFKLINDIWNGTKGSCSAATVVHTVRVFCDGYCQCRSKSLQLTWASAHQHEQRRMSENRTVNEEW